MTKKPAIAYMRVSTTGQAETGAGLDLQRISIGAFAREARFDIIETFRDAQSGVGEDSVQARSGLKAAIEKSRELNCPILVDGLDRFARNTKALEAMVLDGRLNVISTRHGEDAQRAVIIAAGARAQAEAERISRTTKEGLQRARDRGVTLGNTKNLEEARQNAIRSNKDKADKLTQELRPIIQEIRTYRKLTRAQIAEELNRRGHRSPRGILWSAVTIRPQLERIAAWEAEEEAQKERELYRDNPNFGIF